MALILYGVLLVLTKCFHLAYPHHKKVADVYALASWYCEAENYDQPIVIIIDDLEQCSGDVLGELVMMLRYYAP